jgi:hypothetical protein
MVPASRQACTSTRMTQRRTVGGFGAHQRLMGTRGLSHAIAARAACRVAQVTESRAAPFKERRQAPHVRAPIADDGLDLNLAVDPNEPVYCICKQVRTYVRNART